MQIEGASDPILSRLCGEMLSAVHFVMDYVQLQFDNDLVTAIQWPLLKIANNTVRIDDSGYRDKLCSLIGQVVANTVLNNKSLLIVMDSGTSIHIPLNLAPEAMIVDLADQRWGVW